MSLLTDNEIQMMLIANPGWEVIEDGDRRELYRDYKFKDFETAMMFMQRVSETIITPHNHHPRWQNVYNRVSIWLTTHEAGNQPSQKDAEMLRAIEWLFQDKFS